MTVDYKILQTMAPDHAVETEPFCPECGRPWIERSPEPPRATGPVPWHAALLGLVGLYLAITCGLQAWSAHQTVPRDLTYLRETEACLAQHRYSAICTESTAQIDAWTSTPDQVRRDTRLATGGLLTIIVGLGAVARWRLGRKRPSHVLSIPLALWVAGEGLVAAAGLVALALFAGLVVVQLSEGVPFNLDTLDRAAHAVLALITTTTGMV